MAIAIIALDGITTESLRRVTCKIGTLDIEFEPVATTEKNDFGLTNGNSPNLIFRKIR